MTDRARFMVFCLVLAAANGAGCGATVESYGEGLKVLKWMKVPSKRIERLQASALLLQQGPKGTFRGDAYVFYKAPSSLRVDILGPLSNLIGVFIFKNGEGRVLDYTRSAAMLSDNGGCLFSRFMGTDVVLPEFSEIFLGMPPVIPFDESELRWKSKGYYILDLRDSGTGVVEKIQLTRGIFGTVVIRAVVFKDQRKMVDMSFRKRGWKSDVSPLMPRIVEVGFVQEKTQLLFKYKNVETNVKISDDVFDEAVPGDFTIETLGCEG